MQYTIRKGEVLHLKYLYLNSLIRIEPRHCEKISVKMKTVIKNVGKERHEKMLLQFFTVYNRYCKLSRYFENQPDEMERSEMESGWISAAQQLAQPSLSGYMISSSPRTLPQFLSGTVHFLAISCVARYRAFKRAVSLGNTLLCLFRRR